MYRCWAREEEFNALKPLMRDDVKKEFFKKLREEIRVDEEEAQAELRSLGIALRRQTSGSYSVYVRPSAVKRISEPDTTIPTSPEQPKEAATTSPPAAISPSITEAGGSELEDCPPPSTDTSPITTRPPPQPSPSATESTPLLTRSNSHRPPDRDTSTLVILCGCRCI